MVEVQNENGNMLRPYEKHVACLLSAILLSLGYVSVPKTCVKEAERKPISIHVVGAVGESRVQVPVGSTVDDVLQQVALSHEADMLEIDGNKKLLMDGILVVPFKGFITLYVTVSVTEPKVLVIEAPTTASEILKRVIPLESADCARFKRRRAFRTGMVVEIPEKKTTPRKDLGKSEDKPDIIP